MKTETTYIKTLGKVEVKLSRMKEQAAAVRWFYDPGRGRVYSRGMVLGSHSGTAAEKSVRFSGLYPVLSLSGYAEVL